MDVLIYVEATIYHADEENEALSQAGHIAPEFIHAGLPVTSSRTCCVYVMFCSR